MAGERELTLTSFLRTLAGNSHGEIDDERHPRIPPLDYPPFPALAPETVVWGEHPIAPSHCRAYSSDMSTLLIIVILLVLFGGGGGYYYSRRRR